MEHPTWPLFDLRVRTPRLELRPIGDTEAADLIALADEGVHPPAEMPFAVPWTQTPAPRRQWETHQFYWRCWAEWSPTSWRLPFATYEAGTPVGMIELAARDFTVRRVVVTGSWIGLAHQGRGLGTEQRAAVLALAFEHLGAIRAESEAWEDNLASRRVSEKLGYRDNGGHVRVVDGRARRGRSLVLERGAWRRERATNPLHVHVDVDGLAAARPMFGPI